MICNDCGDSNLDYNSAEVCPRCAEEKIAELKRQIKIYEMALH